MCWLVLLSLSACVNPRAILVNKDGDAVQCSATGFGLLTGVMANNRYQQCVSDAQMRGFKFKEAN